MNNKLFFDYNVDIKYKLDNGLTVLLKKVSNLPIISIQVWVKVGSLYEDDDTNGISHFLEHLVFKGTSKYSAEEISQLIESYGAILNAGTSKEYTVYYVDIPREGLEIAFDILFELVFSAKFIEDEVEKERSVVIEEIKRSEDQPINVLYDHFNQLLFTQTPYRRKIIGTEQNIRSLTRASI
ncbi:MAG: insulinase family protein, partial [Endomicrobia bacterium]|nr:insulinase family protein [Endomicrobiia bacterium]